MGIFAPLISAVLQATSFTMDKAVLRLRRIDWQTYTSVSFPLLFFFDLMILIVVRPEISWHAVGGTAGWLVGATIIGGFITNALYYRALDEDYLHELQTWGVFNAIPTLVITGFLFADERRATILVPALIATVAVLWASVNGGHLRIRPKTAPFILWMLAAAPAMAVASKMILRSWDPIMLELVRDGSLSLVFGALVARGIRHVNRRAWGFLFATNALSSVAWILFYYGYQQLGIVYTLLLFSLQPLLTYLFSLLFLREPFSGRKFAAFIVVLASIAAVQLLQ